MKSFFILVIVQLITGCVGQALVSGQPTTTRQDSEKDGPTAKKQLMIHDVCNKAMLQIISDIHDLTKDFNSLSDINKVTVKSANAIDTKTNDPLPIYQEIRYFKNVRTESVKPDAQGNVPQSDEQHIVQKNGVRLEVYLVEGPVTAPQTKSYTLPASFRGQVLCLQYYIEENPENPEMEKAIRNIMDSQAEILNGKLQKLETRSQ